MARWSAVAPAALVVIAVLLTGTQAVASGFPDGSSLISGMVGYTSHESQQSKDRVGGGSWSFDYARVGKGGGWSAGVVVRRFESDESFDSSVQGEEISTVAKRLVTAVQGNYFILDGGFSPYVGALIGVHMQTTEVTDPASEDYSQSSQTLATGFSAGAYFPVTNGIFLRIDYTFQYFADSDTIENNHMHAFYGGVGFQFGGN